MKNILITGGAGFIGSSLANILKKKNNVYILDLKKKIISQKKKLTGCKLISGDISDFHTFQKFNGKFDQIYHLAAKTSSAVSDIFPDKCYETNVLGTCNLMNWANKNKPEFMAFTSSMSVYGKLADNVDETQKSKPISTYGKSKKLGEEIIQNLSSKKINVKILRLFNVYGPNQDYKNLNQGMLSIYLAQVYYNKKVLVTGSLERYRDFVYIDDVISALINCKNFKKHNIFNIGSGRKTKVKDLIDIIFKKLNLDIHNKITVKKTSNNDTWGSYANINRALKNKWKPKINLNYGIDKTIMNIKEK